MAPWSRIRLAGGMITAAQLATLAGVATEFGSPAMELTSRGNIQLRALTDTGAAAAAVADAGLLPSSTHERVRNIVASPLSGRAGGLADIRDLVGDLDVAIQARARRWRSCPADSGSASTTAAVTCRAPDADVGIHLVDADTAALLLAGSDTGVRLARASAVATLVGVARRFADIRGTCWRTTNWTT